MSGLLEAFLDALIGRTERIVVGPKPAVVVGPKPSTTVEPPARQAWDEKCWRKVTAGNQTQVNGAYRAYDRRHGVWREFDGQIIQQGRHVSTYIADPPVELKNHRHGPCLQLADAPWFRLHWNREPKTIDDALLYMERLLDEAFNPTRR